MNENMNYLGGRRHNRSQQQQSQEFWTKFLRFYCMVLCFLLVLLFLIMEGDNVLAYLFMTCFVLGLIAIFGVACRQQDGGGIRDVLTEEELHHEFDFGNNGDNTDPYYQDGGDPSDWMSSCSFSDTPSYILSCPEELSSMAMQPKSGIYKVIYNAVYFGKSIRSESYLQLEFTPAFTNNDNKNRGWTISGSIAADSSKNHRIISAGFLNARGQLFWSFQQEDNNNNNNNNDGNKSSDAFLAGIYRGNFDVSTNRMSDGDFQAGNAPPGRIVRLERVGDLPAPAATTNLEMVSLGNSLEVV